MLEGFNAGASDVLSVISFEQEEINITVLIKINTY
jgi:hypothetical protein